jgi:hypothetical protein
LQLLSFEDKFCQYQTVTRSFLVICAISRKKSGRRIYFKTLNLSLFAGKIENVGAILFTFTGKNCQIWKVTRSFVVICAISRKNPATGFISKPWICHFFAGKIEKVLAILFTFAGKFRQISNVKRSFVVICAISRKNLAAGIISKPWICHFFAGKIEKVFAILFTSAVKFCQLQMDTRSFVVISAISRKRSGRRIYFKTYFVHRICHSKNVGALFFLFLSQRWKSSWKLKSTKTEFTMISKKFSAVWTFPEIFSMFTFTSF